MKNLPVIVRIVDSKDHNMQGKYSLVVVIEGFETKAAAKDHAEFLKGLITDAGSIKAMMESNQKPATQETNKAPKKETRTKSGFILPS